jgi:hypothetical protein
MRAARWLAAALTAVLLLSAMDFHSPAYGEDGQGITKDAFDRITVGMTKGEVDAITGTEGVLSSYTYELDDQSHTLYGYCFAAAAGDPYGRKASYIAFNKSNGKVRDKIVEYLFQYKGSNVTGLQDDVTSIAIPDEYYYKEAYHKITGIQLRNKKLEKIDVSQAKAIESLDLSKNALSALDVSQNTTLSALDASDNRLEALDVSRNTALSKLAVDNNRLETLDISRNTALNSLSAGNNALRVLDLTGNKQLETLYVPDNKLTKLNINANTRLKSLNVSRNKLTKLNVSNCANLWYLHAGSNKLTSLNVRKNSKLDWLDVPGNKLKSIDVSKCKNLSELNASNNKPLKKVSLGKSANTVRLLGCSKLPGKTNYSKLTKLTRLEAPKKVAKSRLPKKLKNKKPKKTKGGYLYG